MKKITIAIDGFSSTGKSTLAKQIAKELLPMLPWGRVEELLKDCKIKLEELKLEKKPFFHFDNF